MTRLVLAACVLVAALPPLAAAQPQPGRPAARPPGAPRIEIGVGAGIAGGMALGVRDAALRSNSVTSTPSRLFSADTRLEPSAAVEVRLGYRATPRLTLEGTLGVGRPALASSLGDDVENAAPVRATTRLTEYLVTGGAIWRLSANARRRWTPFVGGGAGVARHVYDGRALIESGIDGYAGGGLIASIGSRTAVRVDGRVRVLSGGVADGHGASPRGAVSGSISLAF